MKEIPMRSFLLIVFAAMAPAATTYNISVDTSSASGNGGAIYFQFNPGPGTVDAATAIVSGFSLIGGTLAASPEPPIPASVTGVLPLAVTLANTFGLNDYFHTFTYGTQLSFNVELSSTVTTAADSGTVFNLFLLSSDGSSNTFSSTDPNGVLVGVDINAVGVVALSNFNSQLVSASEVTSAIPEPGRSEERRVGKECCR